MTRYQAMHPRDPAWYSSQMKHTAELLAILDRRATPQELAEDIERLQLPSNPKQRSLRLVRSTSE